MIRLLSRCLSALPALVVVFPMLGASASAQSLIGQGTPSPLRIAQGHPTFACFVVGPDRICGGGGGLNYTATIVPPTPGLTYTWSLHTVTTDGCPGTGATNPSFCGPNNQPNVCVLAGTGAGRFVLKLFITDGYSESRCCLSINVTPSTTTSNLVPGVVCHDTTYMFCTTPGGQGPFTYTWAKNGTTIPGATGSCYTATAGSAGTTDNYCVTTTGSGSCGTSFTTCSTLTALGNTTSTPLSNGQACQGQTFQFCTTPSAPGPYSFSWTRNGSGIGGATSSCYTASAGPPGSVDTYCVTVVGPCGPPVVRCATLTTRVDATATPLVNGAVCSGSTYQFCTTAGGTGPFTYSWTRNGANIPGANASCYTATAGPPMMIETYCVTVTGACGSATVCGLLRALANTSATITGPQNACPGDIRVFCVDPAGIPPFTYSWTRNGSTIGGATDSCYTASAPAPGAVDTYCATVTGTCGPPFTVCSTFTGNLLTTATPIGSFSECAGATHVFCTTAGGTPTGGGFLYAWKKNGVFIAGANSACYTATASPIVGHTDAYCVLVTGACNTVTQCGNLTSILCLGGNFATLTQATYGDPGGNYNGVSSPALVEQLLQGDVTIGMTGTTSLTFMPGGHDAMCVTNLLPISGLTDALPDFGDETLEQDCQTLPIPLPLLNGKFENILLGQVVTLSLNMKLSQGMTAGSGCTTLPTDLANQGVCQTMVTRRLLPGPDGCMGTADDVPDLLGPDGNAGTPDNLMTITFPDSVIVALNELQLGQTVSGVLALGNLALAGEPTWTATLQEISAAVDAVNVIFEGGREAAECSHP